MVGRNYEVRLGLLRGVRGIRLFGACIRMQRSGFRLGVGRVLSTSVPRCLRLVVKCRFVKGEISVDSCFRGRVWIVLCSFWF